MFGLLQSIRLTASDLTKKNLLHLNPEARGIMKKLSVSLFLSFFLFIFFFPLFFFFSTLDMPTPMQTVFAPPWPPGHSSGGPAGASSVWPRYHMWSTCTHTQTHANTCQGRARSPHSCPSCGAAPLPCAPPQSPLSCAESTWGREHTEGWEPDPIQG